MRGGLRWPHRPFQVPCVMVAVLLTAAFTLPSVPAGPADGNPILTGPYREVGGRLDGNTITVAGEGGMQSNSSTRSREPNKWRYLRVGL